MSHQSFAYLWGHYYEGDRAPARRPRPVIVANPPTDRSFRALIDRFLLAGGEEARDLQAALRVRYPLAIVRPRELAGESVEVWYVYRDGRWIRTADDDTF